MPNEMKAWLVRPNDEFCAEEIVFAKTRGKARALALCSEYWEDACFTDIAVYRMPQADKFYKEGKWHLDWDDPKDRIALVKDCGFICSNEAFEYEDCPTCPAKHYCDRYTAVEEIEY